MATNYPGGLDSTTQLPDGNSNSTQQVNTHASQHNNLSDAVVAVETELGTLPKGSYSDVKTRLNDGVVQTPGMAQTILPSADIVALIVKAESGSMVSNLFEAHKSDNTTVVYIDRNGNLSAASFLINGTALASTNLSDGASLAPLASPALTGNPTAPTQTTGDTSTKLATTSFVGTAVGNAMPTGSVIAFTGYSAPTGWEYTDGSAVSRTSGTYTNLKNTITFAQTGTTSGTAVTGLSSTSNMFVGMPLEGSRIASATTVAAIVSSTSITLSQNASSNGSVSITFYPHGNGDGSTTFNKPDYRGRTLAGVGTHSDVAAIGKNDSTTLNSRTPRHQHSSTLTLPNHTHTDSISFSVTSADTRELLNGSSSGAFGPTDGNSGSSNSISNFGLTKTGSVGNPNTIPSISGTIGQSSGPTDGPAFSTVQWIIKL